LGAAPSSPASSPLVEFTIPAGTGVNSWNTQADPVTAQVGDTLRLTNGDSVPHRLHTPGQPFPHPAEDLGPGQTRDYVLQTEWPSNDPLYCHAHGDASKFWITVASPQS
jgi:plastocyanin